MQLGNDIAGDHSQAAHHMHHTDIFQTFKKCEAHGESKYMVWLQKVKHRVNKRGQVALLTLTNFTNVIHTQPIIAHCLSPLMVGLWIKNHQLCMFNNHIMLERLQEIYSFLCNKYVQESSRCKLKPYFTGILVSTIKINTIELFYKVRNHPLTYLSYNAKFYVQIS